MFPFANDLPPPHYASSRLDSQEPFWFSSGLCSQIVFCCNAASLLLFFFSPNFLRNQMCKISEVKDNEIEQISPNPTCCCSLQGVAGQQLEGGLVGWERAGLIEGGGVGFYSCECSLKSAAFGFWRIRILCQESLTCGRFQLPAWQDRDLHCCTQLQSFSISFHKFILASRASSPHILHHEVMCRAQMSGDNAEKARPVTSRCRWFSLYQAEICVQNCIFET